MAAGWTVLVVARDEQRLIPLMRSLMEVARAEGVEPVPWDDRTIRVGDGFSAFHTPETIEFVLDSGHWFASRGAPSPEILWDEGARERAAEAAETFPDKSIDRSHFYFGRRPAEDDEE
jgi:hypothetical protein